MARLGLRPLTPDDAPRLVRLAQAGGRNVHAEEYPRFLRLEGAGALGIEDGEDLQAAVSFLRCFDHAILGPVLARDPVAAPGFAIALLGQAVGRLQADGVPRMEAQAGEMEAAVLRALGFHPVGETLVLERPPTETPGASGATRPMAPADLLDVGALDAAAVGHGRKEWIAALRVAHPDGARVVQGPEGVDGYALTRRTRRGYAVGPVVTAGGDPDAALRLVADAAATAPSWPVVLLPPAGSPLLTGLEALGFAPVGRLQRLHAGPAHKGEATPWAAGSRLTG